MKTKLFCFPYAGGSASLYYNWKHKVPDDIEIIPVELAGRGSRASEPLYSTFEELINDIYPWVKEQILNGPYALFGFSMGGLIAYEVYRRALKDRMPLPHHLFIVGREAPNTEIFKVNHLNDTDFIEEVYSYDGMSTELYQNKEVLKYFLPILRSDFGIHETYVIQEKLDKIYTNITVWYGKNDKSIIFENINKWEELAAKTIEIIELDCGHFLLSKYETTIIKAISNQLQKQLSINS